MKTIDPHRGAGVSGIVFRPTDPWMFATWSDAPGVRGCITITTIVNIYQYRLYFYVSMEGGRPAWSLVRDESVLCVVCCVVIPFILDVRFVDVPAGVRQEEGRTEFLVHLPSAGLALIFLARRIQPFLSLVDREVEFCVPTNLSFSACWAFFFFFCVGKFPVRVTAPRFELTSQRVRRFRGYKLNHRGGR